jgi:tetratricopeptide (TPR) repeat protein
LETNKQYQQEHQQRSLFGNTKLLIPIIAVVAAAVIVLVVFGTGIMHQQQPQPQPEQQPSTSAPIGNLNPNLAISNKPPTAVAGTSQTVNATDKVTLDGSGGKDPDGSIVKYSWKQTSGPTVVLNGADTSTPTFTAPNVSSDTVLKFSLTVKDDKGTISNNPAVVTITVKSSAIKLEGRGNILGNLGNQTLALQYYDKALAKDPNAAFALRGKGETLDALGNNTQAIQYYDKVLAIDPNDKYALNDKGHALYNLGNNTQAIQYYDKALAIDPNYTTALSNKGDALSKQ